MKSFRTPSRLPWISQRAKKVLWSYPMRRKSHSSSAVPDDLVDEEHIPGFDPRAFLPVRPGQMFIDRYRTIGKVGWGTASTAWIAEDLQRCVRVLSNKDPKYLLTSAVHGGGNF